MHLLCLCFATITYLRKLLLALKESYAKSDLSEEFHLINISSVEMHACQKYPQRVH